MQSPEIYVETRRSIDIRIGLTADSLVGEEIASNVISIFAKGEMEY